MLRFIYALGTKQQRHRSDEWQLNNEREVVFRTITPPTWWVSEYNPILNLALWRGEASRWLKRLKFTGTAIIEAAAFQNVMHEHGGRGISFHLHAIGFSENPNTYHADVAKLKKHLGRGPVDLPSVVSKPIWGTAADVKQTSGYTAKLSATLKKAVRGRKRKGDLVRNCPISSQLALRMEEIMSYLTIQDVIIARGKAGLYCKKGAFHRVGSQVVTRSPDRMTESELRTLWSRVWKKVSQTTSGAKKKLRCSQYNSVRMLRS